MAEAQTREVAARPTLPGVTLRTGLQLVLRKANARDAYTTEDHPTSVMPNHTACCSCLNSTAQPRPLPDCNHSPGTATVNSSRPTELLLQLLEGQGDEPRLLFQGSPVCVHNRKGSNRQTYPATPFQSLPLLFHSWGRGQGMGSDPSSQGLPSLVGVGGVGQVERRCQLGPGASRCGSENSHQHC